MLSTAFFTHEYYLEYSFLLIAVTINLDWDILQIQNSLNEKVLLTFLWGFYSRDKFNIVKLFTVSFLALDSYSFPTSFPA